MAKDTAETPASAPLPGEKTGGKKKGKSGLLIILLVALFALAGGGGAAYWFLGRGAAAGSEDVASKGDEGNSHDKSAKDKKKSKGPEAEPGMLAFEPFLVNLADEGGQSYLRVALSLLVGSEAEAKALEGKPVVKTRLRSAILEVLSTQTSALVSTAEGKAGLKKAIVEKIQTLELDTEVSDVLFSDFVVQY
jgi:flagellar FliL protein